MKKFLKKNIKIVIAFTLGIIVASTFAYAAAITSNNVSFDNTNSGLEATNVKDAINELYAKSKEKKKITAWKYHKTGTNKCINGEEDTCKKTDCYKSGSTCEMGTVIKYYVNSDLFHYFYVLKDDGSKITMQQRENTIRNIAWHAGSNDNTQGPDTILPMLEVATKTWTNVNVLEYTPGTAPFANTGCTYNSGTSGDYKPVCGVTTYSMSARKARARMITLEEAGGTGCLEWKDGASDTRILGNSIDAYNRGSCPDWMHNYLYQSKSYGGSYEDNTTDENGTYDYAYWTMSAYSGDSARAWYVSHDGYLGTDYASRTHDGARAVVEISK